MGQDVPFAYLLAFPTRNADFFFFAQGSWTNVLIYLIDFFPPYTFLLPNIHKYAHKVK